jgi:hypothetical protein
LRLPNRQEHFSWKAYDESAQTGAGTKRGEGLLCAGHNRISVAFQSTQLEYDWITTSRADLEAQMLARQQENG